MCKFCDLLKESIPLNLYYKDNIFSLVMTNKSHPTLILNEHRNFLFEKEDERLENLIKLWFTNEPINLNVNDFGEENHWHCYIQIRG